MISQFTNIKEQWPGKDSIVTAFRYFLTRPLALNKSVLELGYGSGEGAELLSNCVLQYVGLDTAIPPIEKQKSGKTNFSFIQGDACSMPAEWSNKFDLIICFELVEHVQDITQLRNEINRVMAPDGLAIISTPNFDLFSRGESSSRRPLFKHHLREFTAEEFKDYMAAFEAEYRIYGLSQLDLLQYAPAKRALVLDDYKYILRVGSEYLKIESLQMERLDRAIHLIFSQCFIGLLGEGSSSVELKPEWPPSIGSPKIEQRITNEPIQAQVNTDMEQTDSLGLAATSDIAARAAKWVLQRRNDQIIELNKTLLNSDNHAHNLQGIIKSLEQQIETLQSELSTLQSEYLSLKSQTLVGLAIEAWRRLIKKYSKQNPS